MGFLDRMLSDAIEQSTGFKAKKLVRRIGSRRLLAMGGAALAGGMLAQSAGARSSFGGGAGGGARGGNVVPPKSSAPACSAICPSFAPIFTHETWMWSIVPWKKSRLTATIRRSSIIEEPGRLPMKL